MVTKNFHIMSQKFGICSTKEAIITLGIATQSSFLLYPTISQVRVQTTKMFCSLASQHCFVLLTFKMVAPSLLKFEGQIHGFTDSLVSVAFPHFCVAAQCENP